MQENRQASCIGCRISRCQERRRNRASIKKKIDCVEFKHEIKMAAALLIAVFCGVSLSGWLPKSTAGLCAALSSVSILLMLTRSYWLAIGV